MNKKGFTTVELVVSFTLVSIIVFFLLEIIFVLKDLYVSSGIKTKLLTKQAVLSENLNDDFTSLQLIYASKCSEADANYDKEVCINFGFKNVQKQLIVDRENNSITWGNLKTVLINGSEIGNIKISKETLVNVNDATTLNGILSIDIPIYHKLVEKENFGIKINYQYNSNVVSLSNINVSDIVDAEKKIYLINDEDIKFKDVDYIDSGYYVVDNTSGTVITDQTELDNLVKITGEVGNEVGETYYLTYTIYDMNNNVMSQATRSITVLASEYTFELKGSTETLKIPISGTYKIEAWGASGGGTTIMKGRGGYSSGTIKLTTLDTLHITVGGEGTTGLSGTAATGGYNGGGDSGVSTSNYASSGGGASDIRLNSTSLSSRILVAGGGGGGGSRNDSTATCNGGAGGGATAGIGTCSAASYLGGAGTPTAGGAAATYTDNIITLATAGTFGNGGNGASYQNGSATSSAGGGGGGYYGGGGGSRYGGGGGGSSYCNNSTLTTCDTLANGTDSFPTTSGNSYENGHTGNGYVKITLISITSD